MTTNKIAKKDEQITGTIINCCPHDINIISGAMFDPASRKLKGGSITSQFPAEAGSLASAVSAIAPLEPLYYNGKTIPLCRRDYKKVTVLPDMKNTKYIVSSLYAEACKELGYKTSNLLSPTGMVYNDEGRIIGCTALVAYA